MLIQKKKKKIYLEMMHNDDVLLNRVRCTYICNTAANMLAVRCTYMQMERGSYGKIEQGKKKDTESIKNVKSKSKIMNFKH